MLEVFYYEFHEYRYTEFSRLDQNIRRVLKKTFMAQRIYVSKPNSHVNQHLVNLVINKQLPIWNKNNFCNYKTIYLALKAWPPLELQEFFMPYQLTPSVKEKVNPINNRRQ